MVQINDSIGKDRMAELRRKEEESLIRELAAKYGVQYVDLRGITINPEAILLIPEDTARSSNIAAFELTRKQLSVAIRNPNNQASLEVIKSLEQKGYTVTIYMTSTAGLEHAWSRYADQVSSVATKKGVLDIDPDIIESLSSQLQSISHVAEKIQSIRSVNNAKRISDTLETTFAGALGLGASDIHIEPEENGVRLRYRLNGVLEDVIDLERVIYERLMSRLKLLSGLKLNIRDEAQDGRFSFHLNEREIEVRSSVIPGATGESMVMRLLDPSVAAFRMNTIGLSDKLRSVIEAEINRPNGMIITTGPTGSGKTTALYAFLQEKHKPGVKIITIENPVEYKLEGIVQTQIAEDYTFSSGLRSILRQDPDIIMVGEIRDREVAETAVHAAQTGHLVFSTLHTNSAAGAFPRLIDLGVDSRIIGSALNLVLGQRLVRILCDTCKTPRTPTPDETHLITTILDEHPEHPDIPNPLTIYEPTGCVICNNSGFTGRAAVFEAIVVDTQVEDAVLRDPREHIIIEAASPQGIPTMAEDGIHKVIRGETSLTELRRVVDITHTRGGDSLSTNSPKENATPKISDDDFLNHVV